MHQLAFYLRRGILYSLAGLVCKIVPESWIRLRYFVVFRICANHACPAPNISVECRWCNDDQDVGIAETISRFKRSRFKHPLKASLAYHGNQAIGACWLAEEFFDERELGIRIRLKPTQRWLFGAMVSRGFRGQGVFPQLLDFTIDGGRSDSEFLAAVNPLNKPSMAVFQAHSQSIAARVFAIQVLGFSVCFCRGTLQRDRYVSTDCRKNPITLDIDCESSSQ